MKVVSSVTGHANIGPNPKESLAVLVDGVDGIVS
jgi:hypothetical protein